MWALLLRLMGCMGCRFHRELNGRAAVAVGRGREQLLTAEQQQRSRTEAAVLQQLQKQQKESKSSRAASVSG